jgi:hypothetical protein
LLVDDLHWADPDSLGLLSYLLRRLRDRPFGLIATMRPWPSEATVLAQDLETTGQASIERLAPLGSSAAEQVAMRAAGGRLSPVELEQVVESCRGNPLLLEQAAAATAAGAPSLPQTCSPAQQLVARFAGLPPSVLAVARAASVVGTRFSPRLAGAVAEVDETAASFALGALIRAGLATSHPDGLVEFAHPLFRQALYDTIEQPERSRLHALALRALLAQGADPAQAAAHAMAGQLVGDALAIEALETAGRTALAGGALESALRLLSSAEGLAGHQAGPQLLLDLAEAELAAVRLGHVKETCGRLLNRSPGPADRADALVMLAKAWVTVDPEQTDRCYREAVEAAEGTDRLVGVLAQAVMMLRGSRGPAGVLTWSERLRAFSTGLSPAQRAQVDTAWGAAAALAGDAAGARVLRSALGPGNLRSVMKLVTPAVFPLMLSVAFDTRLFVEEFDEADQLFEVAWEVAEGQGALLDDGRPRDNRSGRQLVARALQCLPRTAGPGRGR